jgi:cytoskeletal protein RodZ
MKRSHKTYRLAHLVSAAFMMLALLWLTVSVAFVFPTQQQLAKQDKVINAESSCTTEDDSNNPFSNTTEEKSSSNSSSFSEEYLHNHHTSDDFISVATRIHNSRNCGTYNAFHGEVHVPPPNLA